MIPRPGYKALHALSTHTCRCGNAKSREALPFCGGCYQKLPNELQMALHYGVAKVFTGSSQAYLDAYAEAVKVLDGGAS